MLLLLLPVSWQGFEIRDVVGDYDYDVLLFAYNLLVTVDELFST